MKTPIYELYCDESGNTGPRLLQADQPFFVYAFVLLCLNKVGTIHDKVVRIYSEEGIQPEDLKSSKLWSSSRGLKRYERIGLLLAQSGTSIYFSIVEKRYEACVHIVETFLDPAYNPRARGAELLHAMLIVNKQRTLPLTEDEVRQIAVAEASKYNWWLTNQLYLWLDNTILDRFLTAQKSDDVAGMKMVGNMIARRLALHHDDCVVDASERILAGLDCFFRFAERIPGAPVNHDLPAGQQAAFFPSLSRIDAHLRLLNIQAILVCDEDLQFGELLKHTFEEACIMGDLPYSWEFGATESLTNIVGMEQVPSHGAFGVQLADLATGLVNRMAITRVRKLSLTARQQRVVAAWRPCFAPRGSHFFMASDATFTDPCIKI